MLWSWPWSPGGRRQWRGEQGLEWRDVPLQAGLPLEQGPESKEEVNPAE